jgi:hypothetical protein
VCLVDLKEGALRLVERSHTLIAAVTDRPRVRVNVGAGRRIIVASCNAVVAIR